MKGNIYRLTRLCAGICTKKQDTSYIIPDGMPAMLVQPDTVVSELDPTKNNVICPDGKSLPLRGRFLVTVDANGPYHIVLDTVDDSALDYLGTKP